MTMVVAEVLERTTPEAVVDAIGPGSSEDVDMVIAAFADLARCYKSYCGMNGVAPTSQEYRHAVKILEWLGESP